MSDPSRAEQELLAENALLRKRIEDLEQSGRTSEELLRAIVEKTYVGIYTSDDDFHFSYVNDKLCEMTGYTREELLGMDFRRLIAGESLPLVEDRYLRRRKGEEVPAGYEFIGIRKDGEKRVYSFMANVLRHDDGRVATIGHLIDVTDRKREEEKLRLSEEKFMKVFMTTPDCVAITRLKDGTILEVNLGFEEVMGWKRSEVNGRTSGEINFWEDLAERDFMVGELKAGRDVLDRGFQFRRKDGDLRTGVYSARPIQIADEACLIFILQDMTERRRTEEALRESEANYRQLFENAPTGIYRIDFRTGKFSRANEVFRTFLGASPEEMASISAYEILTEESRKLFLERLGKIARGIKVPEVVEYEIVNKEGRRVSVQVHNRNVYDEEGRLIAADVVAHDITERKRAEQLLKETEERLQRAEKMEALGTLAGGVAHDLNNIMGVVTGYAELLLMDVDESSPIGIRLTNIKEGGQRASAIVQDLLTLARRGVTSREVLNLNDVITESLHSPEFEKLHSYHPRVRVATDLEPDLMNISGSSVHLGKSLFNLVSNASEAMASGGVVTIRTGNQYVDQPIQGYDEIQEGDYVVLVVSDTGEGISEADLNRIFEPFYTKKVMGRSGTGLGLAVVWGTVKDHNGYINVRSEKGKGSVFTLYFPVTREQIAADALPVAIAEYMGRGETILVVDDIKEQCELALDILQKLHYNVRTVTSGEDAIDYLREHEADLMILDMIMGPGMDGLDTYQNALAIRPGQKAIIVSGFSESDRVQATLSLGAGAYVRKPYVMEKLGLTVRQELDRK